MDYYSHSLIFMGVSVVLGLGIVISCRPDGAAMAGAILAGLAVTVADFVCAAMGHRYDLWHLHGALSVLDVPLSLSVAWVFLTAAVIALFDRIRSTWGRLAMLGGTGLAGAAGDHFLLRPLGMLSWGDLGPLAIIPYWLVMVGLAIGVYFLVLGTVAPGAEVAAASEHVGRQDWKPTGGVSLARCQSYDPEQVLEAMTRLLAPLGGMQAFVPEGATVLLKPNYLSFKPNPRAVCTHPAVIWAAARLCLDAGAGRVLVGDSPAMGKARGISKKLGLMDLLENLPGDVPVEVVNFDEAVEVRLDRPDAVFKSYHVARQITEADVIINLAKIKTHAQMYLTLAVKNCFGAVVGLRKSQWHLMAGKDYDYFGRMLVDLYRLVGPGLNIVDGVLAMEGNGPAAGTPRQLDVLAASADGLALDRVLTSLVGFAPTDVPTLRVAGAVGPLTDLVLHGDPLDDFMVQDFKPARPAKADMATIIGRLGRSAISPKPVIDHALCTRCKQCQKHCPPSVMTLVAKGRRVAAGPGPGPGPTPSDQRMDIDLDGCIRCFCCQEVCPEEAITVREGWMSRLGLVR